MLRVFHTYRKTVFGILVVSIAAVSMTGFGVNAFHRYEADKVYAVKVDDERIGHVEFEREREQLQNRYRAMLGKNYGQLAGFLEANLGQQVIDKIISDTLMLREAKKNEIYSGSSELERIMRQEVFGGNFDADMYRQFLRQINQSAAKFEAEIRDSAVRAQFVGLLSDVTFPSDEEARALWEREETSYAVRHLEFDPATFEANVGEPEVKVLEEFYSNRASEYELPARVAYEYVVFDPSQFRDLVTPSDEDIELHYAENSRRFMTAPETRARHIQFTFAKNAKPEEMVKLKEKATEVLAKLRAGEPFDSLATQFSDDITSNTIGGDLGSIVPGKMSGEFDAAVARLTAGQISDVVETPYGYHIIKVESRTEAEPQKLEVVRDTIIAEIKMREAPAYTAEKAHQIFEMWNSSTQSLGDIATAEKLERRATEGLVSAEADPAPDLMSLSRQVLQNPEVKKQLLEIGERSVLVSVTEYKEPTIPALAEIKERLLADYRKTEGARLARAAASEALAALEGEKAPSLEAFAKERKLPVVNTPAISRANPGSGPLADTTVQEAIFTTFTPLATPTQVFEVGGKSYILQVVSITPPDRAKATEKLATFKKRAVESNSQAILTAVLAGLKADSNIDIDPQLLASR
jgi:peptidyl-prolyl cis-trans isomerase D